MTRLESLGLVICASLIAGSAAAADTTRFALVIGNNRGLAADVPLRFAETDAERMGRMLVDLGGFPEENTTLLKGRRAGAVRRALLSINTRIRRSTGQGKRVMLFVYYSGHADARDLHLHGMTLPTEELRKMVTGSAATVRILVVDACHSGSATRVKGGRPAPTFAIQMLNRLSSEGLAIITSSAATEESQESDKLRGSFFTHYFLSGLRGAADRNRDRRVSLAEAYAYAYGNTLRTTSKTLAGPQHPTYEYDIRGKGDFVITRLDRLVDHGVLRFRAGGHFFVLKDDAKGPVVAEVVVERSGAQVVLPAGTYFVRKRQPDLLMEGTVSVRRKSRVSLDERAMRRVAYAQLVRKGGTRRWLSHGPLLSYAIHGPVAEGLGPLMQIELGYPLAIRHLTLAPRVAFGGLNSENDRLELTHRELSVSLAGYHAFDLSRISLFIGLVSGWTMAMQSFTTVGKAPDRLSHLFSFGGEGGVDLHLGLGFYLQVRGALITYLFEQGPSNASSSSPALTYQAAAGIGWQVR